MKKFIFTGRGSAFLTSEGNTSCYLKDEKNFLLIDCGETVFSKLKEYDLINKSYEKFIVCLTHLHPDHAGSLGSLIFYMYYIQNVKVLIIYKDKEKLFSYLDLIGVSREMYEITSKDEELVNVLGIKKISFIKTNHVKNMSSYGFLFEDEKEKVIVYTGDTNKFPIDLKNTKLNIERIYTEVSYNNYEGNPHLYIEDLKKVIPNEYREKTYCMHIDDYRLIDAIEESKMKVVTCD